MRPTPLDAAIVVGGGLLRLLLDRPPDQVDQGRDRQLERQHQPQKSPRHETRILSRSARDFTSPDGNATAFRLDGGVSGAHTTPL